MPHESLTSLQNEHNKNREENLAKAEKFAKDHEDLQKRHPLPGYDPMSAMDVLHLDALREDDIRTESIERLQDFEKALQEASIATGLSPQEILNVAYRGEVMKLQKEMSRLISNIGDPTIVDAEMAKRNLKFPW